METLRIGRPPQLSTRARLRRAAREIGARLSKGFEFACLVVALLALANLLAR